MTHLNLHQAPTNSPLVRVYILRSAIAERLDFGKLGLGKLGLGKLDLGKLDELLELVWLKRNVELDLMKLEGLGRSRREGLSYLSL